MSPVKMACHTRCIYSVETSKSVRLISVNVIFGKKVTTYVVTSSNSVSDINKLHFYIPNGIGFRSSFLGSQASSDWHAAPVFSMFYRNTLHN